ncbi:uncharacterized protein ACLA_012710 [Aspergillus clavatus NRRL 1]|uniref:Uncharacterized protein n=1 Tax=Aspergillus clavatus (strain ATCC 1007 / CBS 513.65 / DSM 816 / NCTC 3887 / NRRL 1 / QM 1276 / 107) TaxID=344612 RepID=A1CAS5_ASPCL|nr:uncharacterized protein ACLA_012710 [Aspergillus clavatus NRRL 1]EAW12843.1 conserved hypothetical protein [Aspergillus clavatus NRRL 1]
MAYYEPQGWQAPSTRQASWEHPVQPPSRSGSSSVSQREEMPAFSSQFDEVDRAIDNLVKSGKLWTAPRRDSMPMMMGRPYPDYDPRVSGNVSQRHHSISEFDGSRMHHTPNVQGYYASQRFQQGRPNEVEQMMQAKRRMAAQRERELRNYHQEQQYNRSLLAEMSGAKSDRSLSPAAMSEESRRELLSRQHRALYGNESPAFFPPSNFADDNSRPESQAGGTPSSAAGVRAFSPRGIDSYGNPQISAQDSTDGIIAQAAAGAASLQSPSRANSTASPSSGINPVFGKFEGADQPVASSSSPGRADSPSSRQPSGKPTAGPIGSVGPIGSRPVQQSGPAQMSNPALNKRSTTPLPSPLGFGFTSSDGVAAGANNDRAVSSASNPTASASATNAGVKEASGGVGLGWGNGSGVWGSKGGLGVQASVWG